MKQLKLIILLCTAITLSNSCTKEGQTGPAGPAGSSNFNITQVTCDVAGWSPNASPGYGNWYGWYAATPVSVTTTDICNIYVSQDKVNFSPLPYSNYFDKGDEFNFYFSTGNQLILTYYDPTKTTLAINEPLYFNIAVITPALIKKYPNTNWNDFNQVRSIAAIQNNLKN
jgi:hypothetical protein